MAAAQSENIKRIAKNTLLLYIRMLFGMLVSLYTSRVILNTLGVEDYGVYNVVGGVVAMFSIISNSLSVAVSRFLTFELGTGNRNKLQRIFSTSLIIHIALAIIILVAAESIGVWFLNTRMNIPADRMYAANWVLQCSILSFMFNLVSVPYNALIVAHERMKVFAYIGILDVLLRLAVVLSLAYMFDGADKLITRRRRISSTGSPFTPASPSPTLQIWCAKRPAPAPSSCAGCGTRAGWNRCATPPTTAR